MAMLIKHTGDAPLVAPKILQEQHCSWSPLTSFSPFHWDPALTSVPHKHGNSA